MAWTRHHSRGSAGVPALEAVVRRSIAVVFALVEIWGCAPPRPVTITPPPAATLAVITWNMHVGAGDLQRLVTDLADGRLTGTPPANYVLLLQEATTEGPHSPAAVARDRQLSYVFEPLQVRGSRTSGNAMVATLSLMNTRTIELPRERQRRAAVLTTIELAGRDLFIVNVHLENRVSLWRGLLFSDGPRGRQARALIDQLPRGHGIAGGDLNTWLGPDEPAWKAFAARFPDTPAARPEPTVRDRLAIDHLFFDVPDGWLVERHVLPDPYGSDHRPVLGVITAPRGSAE